MNILDLAIKADLWQAKAEKLVVRAQECLQKNPEIVEQLASRGISPQTAADYRIGWNPGEDGKDLYRARKAWGLTEVLKEDGRPRALWIPRGLVIPYIVGGSIFRIRIRRSEGEHRYCVLPGSTMSMMVIARERRAFVIVESELDAIAVAVAGDLAGAVATGSPFAKPDAEACAVLNGALCILNALDCDTAGLKAVKWCAEEFKDRCVRWPVPKGKCPGDAFRLGVDLESWIEAGLPPALTIGKHGEKRPVKPKDVEQAASWLATTSCDSSIASPEKPPAVMSFNYPPPVRELYRLLRRNPRVKIINAPNRYTVLRDGKYVGGLIKKLVFKTPEVRDYIARHPEEEIHAGNFVIQEG